MSNALHESVTNFERSYGTMGCHYSLTTTITCFFVQLMPSTRSADNRKPNADWKRDGVTQVSNLNPLKTPKRLPIPPPCRCLLSGNDHVVD